MNWYGGVDGKGYEYHILVITIAIGLIIRRYWLFLLDRLLSRRLLI